ncbi:MAG: hypothetical protein IJS31_01925 [Oscillospiraceae bacterium]|nr:hypothetical protein [Oscillospiraceae bacterium]
MGKTAFFIQHPRTIDDLRKPHFIEQEHAYMIAATVLLGKMDYENFIFDLCADRQFLQDYCDCCSDGSVFRCVLVKMRKATDGILVVPENRCFVKFAAYISG